MDFSQICRLCGEIKKKMTSIFIEDGDQMKNETLDKIFYVSSIEPFKGDGLPEMICRPCRRQLNISFDFKQTIISCDEKFKHFSLEDVYIKTEIDDWDNLGGSDDGSVHGSGNVSDKEREENDEPPDDPNFMETNDISEPGSETAESSDENEVPKEKTKEELLKKAEERQKRRLEKQKEYYQQIKKKRICPECGVLVTNGSFNDHMLTKHSTEAKFTCEICNAKFKTKRTLWHHKRSKHEERPSINCDQCGMIFRSRNNFKRHYSTIHLDIRKHKCDICDKTFKFWKSFQAHVRSHTGERPFVCSFCNRGFSGAWALKQHVWLHTNEKPYKCQHCEEAFTQNVTLKLHIKRKHMGLTADIEKEKETDVKQE